MTKRHDKREETYGIFYPVKRHYRPTELGRAEIARIRG